MKSSKMIHILKQGNIVIPLYLIQNIQNLKLSLDEFLVLMYLYNIGNKFTFNPTKIAEDLNMSLPEVMNYISVLSDKKFLTLETFKNDKNILEEQLNLENFYMKLSLLMSEEINKPDVDSSTIFEVVEKEFGRTLSPMEYEIMKAWVENGFSDEVMKEAVREATYNGVSNLRYIDKILYEWEKKGIKTKEDIEKNRQQHKERKAQEETIEVEDFDWFEEDEE